MFAGGADKFALGMSPLTHLLASWIIAAKTTDNLRDRRLVSLAGVIPDLDGLGLFVDWYKDATTSGKYEYYYYPKYHHFVGHGLPAALLCAVIMAAIAHKRWRVFGLALVAFHLHVLCDFLGSRGPDAIDLWPIMYLGPLRQNPIWFWRHQWPLDGWQNFLITIVLFVWSLAIAIRLGDSFIGVVNHKRDRYFVSTLQQWHARWKLR